MYAIRVVSSLFGLLAIFCSCGFSSNLVSFLYGVYLFFLHYGVVCLGCCWGFSCSGDLQSLQYLNLFCQDCNSDKGHRPTPGGARGTAARVKGREPVPTRFSLACWKEKRHNGLHGTESFLTSRQSLNDSVISQHGTHRITLRSTVISSSHIRFGLPSGLHSSGIHAKATCILLLQAMSFPSNL
jgi:hypothetical protein